MEARRAQGFPDDEVLLGTPAEGWKLMGNSVARTVALALGLSLREAWLKNGPEAESLPTKVSIVLPATNRQKRSGIKIVLPVATRSINNGVDLVQGPASKEPLAVKDELAPDSPVRKIGRPVAPNKARRSRSAPDSEPARSKGSTWPVSRHGVATTDSEEVSADEISLGGKPFRRFLGTVDLRTSSSCDELVLPNASAGSASRHLKQLPRKRPHGMMQQSVENAVEPTRKVPRVIIPLRSSSSGPTSRPPHQQYPKAQLLNPSALAKKLNDVRMDQTRRERDRFGADQQEDSDVEIIPRKSLAVRAPSLTSRVRPEMTKTSGSGNSKTLSNRKSKGQVVISLLSDDEDEDVRATVVPSDESTLPFPTRYVPIDNSSLAAYAQTNRFMNHGKDRKRVAAR